MRRCSLDSTAYAAATYRGVEAMPLGLRDGGMRLKHNFPVDGDYRFNILFPDQTLGLYTASLENEATLVLMIDGKVMFKKPIGGLNDLTLNNEKRDGGADADRFPRLARLGRRSRGGGGISIAAASNRENQGEPAALDVQSRDQGPYTRNGDVRRRVASCLCLR